MRAAAISPARMAFPIAMVSLLLVAMVLVLQNLVIPKAEYSAAQLRGKTMVHVGLSGIEEEAGIDADKEFWTRNAGQFIRFSSVLPDRSLADVEVYLFDESGNLQRMLQSPKAQLLQDSAWLLRSVHDTQIDNRLPQSQFQDSLIWQALLSEKQARTMMMPVSSLASADLWRTIRRLEENGMNAEPQRIVFWTQMSIPVGVVGMALMALPFLLGSVRSVSVGQRIAMGGLIGISYYLIQQISGYLAGIVHGHVLLIVMTPGLVVLLAAIIMLKRAGQ
jgi:lipopolysaccharide export system permease protein